MSDFAHRLRDRATNLGRIFTALAIAAGILAPYSITDYTSLPIPGSLQSWFVLGALVCWLLTGPRPTMIGYCGLGLIALIIIHEFIPPFPFSPIHVRALLMGGATAWVFAWQVNTKNGWQTVSTTLLLCTIANAVFSFAQSLSGHNLLLAWMYGDYLGKAGLDTKIGFGFTYSALLAGLYYLLALGIIIYSETNLRKSLRIATTVILFIGLGLTANRSCWLAAIILVAGGHFILPWRKALATWVLAGGTAIVLYCALPSANGRVHPCQFSPLSQFGAGGREQIHNLFCGNATTHTNSPPHPSSSSEPIADQSVINVKNSESASQNTQGLSSPKSSLTLASNSRKFCLDIALDLVAERPLTGWGLGRFDLASAPLVRQRLSPELQSRLADKPELIQADLDVLAQLTEAPPRQYGYQHPYWTIATLTRELTAQSGRKYRNGQLIEMLTQDEIRLAKPINQGISSHNTWAALGVDLGVILTLTILTYLAWMIYRWLRHPNPSPLDYRLPLLLGFSFLVISCFWHIQFMRPTWILLGFLGAVWFKPDPISMDQTNASDPTSADDPVAP